MSDRTFIESIAIGASGGTAVWLIGFIREKYNHCADENVIVQILQLEGTRQPKYVWRSTRTIASYCNLTEDRVRYICSVSKKIKQSKRTNEVWTLIKNVNDSDDQAD